MLVMAMLGAHAVYLRVTVEEKTLCECEMTWRVEELTVVMVPPAVPMAGRGKAWSRWKGRKERSLASV